MKTVLLLLILVFGLSNVTTSAQNNLKGVVEDSNHSPLQGVTLMILNPADSSFLSGTITQTDGTFIIENLPQKEVLLEASMIGFKKKYQSIMLPEKTKVDIVMDEDIEQLKEVVVLGNRNQIQVEAGKTVVNLGISPLGLQGNALDVLSKLPGVIIRDDGSVYLHGKSGVNVLINDKPTYLSGDNLINMLRSLSSTSVSKIELITHPSSKFDASGNSGIINIQTKQVRQQGVSLSAYLNIRTGKYLKGNSNITLALRKNKFNFYLDYSPFWGKNYLDVDSYRDYYDDSDLSKRMLRLGMTADRRLNYQSHFLRSGMDIDISDKTTFGTYITYNRYNERKNEITLSQFLSNSPKPDSTLRSDNVYDKLNTNLTGGVNLSYNNKNLKGYASFDFQLFDHSTDQTQKSSFQLPGLLPVNDTLTGGINASIDLYSAQTNLDYRLSDIHTFSSGLKASFVTIHNRAHYVNYRQGSPIEYEKLNNTFSYSENIFGAYAQLVSKWNPRFQTEVGLRIEKTDIRGQQRNNTKDSTYTQAYTDLFPSIQLKYKLSDSHSLALLYGRRINRPNYRDLNPLIEINDRFLYDKGNTELKPETTENIELSYFLKNQYSVSLFYTYKNNPIAKSYLLGENNVTIVTPSNLSSAQGGGIRIGVNNLNPTPWWTTNINFTATYKRFYWMAMGVKQVNERITPFIHVNNQFTLPLGWSAEITGYYNGNMAEGQALIHPIWTISGGVMKTFSRYNTTVRLYVDDIFKSDKNNIDIYSPKLNGSYTERKDSRLLSVTVIYRFNSGSKTKESRKNSISESNRINL